MRLPLWLVRSLLVPFLVASHALASSTPTLPGFTLVGEDWTYDPGDGGVLITGKLIQPTTGSAPHPAILISHGQNGGASGFGVQKANVLKTWGFVCIAPNYTHVDLSYAPGTDGYSDENARRAGACLTILASLGNVDMARVAAYGNSKGAYLTAGWCGGANPQIRAAAITAGGTSGTTNTFYAAPATQEVDGITAPFLMLHGTADTTVDPSQSAGLAAILAPNGVSEERWLWQGVGHNLHNDRANDVYTLMRGWFSAHGVLGEPGNTAPSIVAPADLSTQQGSSTAALAFTVGDTQTSASALVVGAFALDSVLLPPAGIVLGGSGTNRSVTLTPAAGQSGSTVVVLSVGDGDLVSVRSFTLFVGSGTQVATCTGDGLDPRVTSACPCANFGAAGRGCANSADAAGALLSASGTTSPDTLVLASSAMPATAACIFLQGDAAHASVLGDGVRCASGTLIRLGVEIASAGASHYPAAGDPLVSVRGAVTPGSGALRVYQVWYRDPSPLFCPSATTNMSNGWSVVW